MANVIASALFGDGAAAVVLCGGQRAEAPRGPTALASSSVFYEGTENVMGWADMPGQASTPETKDRIMHAVLRIGEGVLMLSDAPPGAPVTAGNNMHITLDFDDAADMARKFDALSAGGKVTMALQDTFWGATFGILVDPYGVGWMLNCTKKP